MVGPNFWRAPGTRLKKCSEFTLNADCPKAVFDDCCAVVACDYCLEFDVYGEDLRTGIASFNGTEYSGSIAGAAFLLWVQRNYDTDECESVATLDGEEIAVLACYDGMSCRDLSGSAEVTIGYDTGTLTWTKIEPKPLEHITDPDTGCKTWFCDECECTCECLCVTITDGYSGEITVGEICDVTYECDTPIWEGTVGDYELSLALGRDDYGQCIITPTVDGIELASVLAPGCGEMASTITLDDGTTIAVSCKRCGCEDDETCCTARTKIGTTVEITIAGQINESTDLWHIDETRTLEWDTLLGRLVYYGPGGPTRGAGTTIAELFNEMMSAVLYCENTTTIALQIATSYPDMELNAFNCTKFFDCETWGLTKPIEISNCFEFFDAFPLPIAEPNVHVFDPIACESATNPDPNADTFTETADLIRIRSTSCVFPDHNEYVGYSYLIRIVP